MAETAERRLDEIDFASPGAISDIHARRGSLQLRFRGELSVTTSIAVRSMHRGSGLAWRCARVQFRLKRERRKLTVLGARHCHPGHAFLTDPCQPGDRSAQCCILHEVVLDAIDIENQPFSQNVQLAHERINIGRRV